MRLLSWSRRVMLGVRGRGVKGMAEVGVGVGIYFEAKLGLVVVLS